MSVKKFNFSMIKKRRNNIAAFLLEQYLNVPITGSALYSMTSGLMDFLPSTASAAAVFETVRVLAGTSLDRRKAQEFAWRIAGNVDKLVAGDAVLPWTRQIADEIVPIRVETVMPTRRKNDFGFIFQCRVLAGSSCPMAFQQFLSARTCKVLSRVVGFSNTSWGPHQYAGVAAHFTNLMFFAHIEAERSHDKPGFQNISVSSGMLRANKALIEVRCRTKPCPRNLEHSCAICYVGYGECGYAVHPKTFVEQHCRNCDKISFFNPEDPGVMCINCHHKSGCVSQ
jgi:hypothetical protein